MSDQNKVEDKDTKRKKLTFWESVRLAAEEVSTWPKWKCAGVLARREVKGVKRGGPNE